MPYFFPRSAEIVNPGGETGLSSINYGWEATFSGGGLAVRSMGDARTGNHIIFPGSVSRGWGGQWLSTPSSVNAFIDQGIVKAYFSAYQKGLTSDSDKGALYLNFYDSSSEWLGAGGTIPTDYGEGSWSVNTVDMFVPKNTRLIHAGIKGVRVTGTEISAYFDDFNLVYEQDSNYLDYLFREKGNNQNSMTVVSGTAIYASSSYWGPEQPHMFASGAWFQYRKNAFPIPDSHWSAINSQFTKFWVGWQHGDFGNDDKGRLVVLFTTSGGIVVGSFSLPTSTTAAGASSFITRSMYGTVPQSAALFDIIFEGERLSGTNLDAYFSHVGLAIVSPNSLELQAYSDSILEFTGYRRNYPSIPQRLYPGLISRKEPL